MDNKIIMPQKYDFDTLVDRTHTASHKWHKYKDTDIIPMWVADMDFRSPPEVLEALHRRVEHGVFGYGGPMPELKTVVIEHLYSTYGWQVSPDWIVWLPGLVTGLNLACRTVGRSGAGVLTTTPVYPPFLSAPGLSGKKLQTNHMVYLDNYWVLDMDAFTKSIHERTALYLLCNPHNPTGRMFTRKELEDMAEICLANNMVICSDEIHCDLVLEKNRKHIPTATLSPEIADRTITLMAPSKTFNIPGLGCSFAIISNPRLRRRFRHAGAGIVPMVNIMGFTAAHAAYAKGKPWLYQALDYLRANRDFVFDAVNTMDGLSMGPVEATYLAWIDTRTRGIDQPGTFFEKAGVGLFEGTFFGAPGFVRLNFGCPRQLLAEALDRMGRALQ